MPAPGAGQSGGSLMEEAGGAGEPMLHCKKPCFVTELFIKVTLQPHPCSSFLFHLPLPLIPLACPAHPQDFHTCYAPHLGEFSSRYHLAPFLPAFQAFVPCTHTCTHGLHALVALQPLLPSSIIPTSLEYLTGHYVPCPVRAEAAMNEHVLA